MRYLGMMCAVVVPNHLAKGVFLVDPKLKVGVSIDVIQIVWDLVEAYSISH